MEQSPSCRKPVPPCLHLVQPSQACSDIALSQGLVSERRGYQNPQNPPTRTNSLILNATGADTPEPETQKCAASQSLQDFQTGHLLGIGIHQHTETGVVWAEPARNHKPLTLGDRCNVWFCHVFVRLLVPRLSSAVQHAACNVLDNPGAFERHL